jgi:3-phosphoshikimate 1-carboxyvinyltransferase
MTIRSVRPAPLRGQVQAPPSKSYTHRALVAAFLSDGDCEISSPLDSDDTRATREGLRQLGAHVRRSPAGWRISPPKHGIRSPHRPIQCGESGTTLRFLSAVAALGTSDVSFDGAPQLATRPMQDLYGALRSRGVLIRTPPSGRSLPCTIRGPLTAGPVSVRGDVSSQFTSALMMVLPTLDGRSELRIQGAAVSEPYVAATRAVLAGRGVRIRGGHGVYSVPGGQRYRCGRIHVPGDASSAAYLWAGAAVTAGNVEVSGVPLGLPQADLALLPILSKMGAGVRRSSRAIRVTGPLTRPITVDLTNAPDLFPLVSVLASVVPNGHSTLSGAPHLEFKESDRRTQSIRLARAIGATVQSHRSQVEISGTSAPRPLDLVALDDHRLVMSAAVAALASKLPSRIGRAEAVSKSFPGFWRTLGLLTEARRKTL